MRKKVILVFFIIIGIIILSNKSYAAVTANNLTMNVTVTEGEELTLKEQEITGRSGYGENPGEWTMNSAKVSDTGVIKVEANSDNGILVKRITKVKIKGIKIGSSKIFITVKGGSNGLPENAVITINVTVKADPNRNSYPKIIIEDIGEKSAVKLKKEDIMTEYVKAHSNYKTYKSDQIMNNYTIVDENVLKINYSKESLKLVGLKAGSTMIKKIQLGIKNVANQEDYQYIEVTYLIEVTDKQAEIEKIQEEKDKVLKDAEEAYNAGTPSKNATAAEIRTFVAGCYLNNKNGDKLKKVDKAILTAWKNTLDKAIGSEKIMYDIYGETRQTIKEQIKVLEGNGSAQEVDKHGAKVAEKITEYYNQALKSYDDGEQRGNTTYVSVFSPEGKELFNPSTPNGENNTTLIKMTSTVLGVIQVVGSVLSVLVLVILGIKYMAGSVEEKADYKKELPVYALGALILFSVTNLLSIIYNWAIGFNNIS